MRLKTGDDDYVFIANEHFQIVFQSKVVEHEWCGFKR